MAVDEQHLTGRVAHDVVAPACEFELLCVECKGEAGHGGADDAAEVVLIGDNVDPRHGCVGIGDDVVVTVKTTVLVVELQRAPDTEFASGLQDWIFHLVLVGLVGCFEACELLFDGEAFGGAERELGDRAEEGAFVVGDVVSVKHEDFASLLMCGPEVFGVGHCAHKACEAIVFVNHVVYDDQVDEHSMHFVVFKGAEHFLGEATVGGAVHFQEDDVEVATYAEAPEGRLREAVGSQEGVPFVAECGCLADVFGDAVVESHVHSFEG